jgi:superfamily II RNA helicase
MVKKLKARGFIKADKLTEKGDFASKIYADEVETAEIFATTFADSLTEYEILVIFAMIAYEPKDKDKFFKPMKHNKTHDLRRKLRKVRAIEDDERFRYMFEMASLVESCFNKGSFFDIIDLTNQSEGDLIRLFSQMLDRLRQVRRASFNMNLNDKLDVLSDKITHFLQDVKEI